jgi:TPR repeat protein
LEWAYIIGEGVAQDMVEAVKWFRLAAEQGEAGAQGVLGNVYYEGIPVKQDEEYKFSMPRNKSWQ